MKHVNAEYILLWVEGIKLEYRFGDFKESKWYPVTEGHCWGGPDLEYREKPDPVKAALTQALIDRDKYYDWADALAAHISTLTGVDIGDNTSENKSWLCAAMAADAHQPKKWKGLIDTEIDSEVSKSIEPWGFSRGVKWAEKELKARNT